MKHWMAAKRGIGASVLLLAVLVGAALGQDPGWPRQIKTQAGTLTYYQPQVDEWSNFTDLTWRMAFTLVPVGGKEVVGVVAMQGHTDVDNDNKLVLISNLQVTGTHFPSLDPASAASMEQLVKTFLPPTVTISLHRLVAVVQKADTVTGVPVNNDPPVIVVAYSPSILLAVDGEPSLAQIPKTNLQFVVNTTWPLFFEKSGSNYYLLVGQQWMTAHSLDGPWSATEKLAKDISKVAKDPQWARIKAMVPPPKSSSGVIPQIFYSNRPAEIILFNGHPVFSKIPGTQLVYSTNTSAYLFVYTATNQFYYLTGGRWFRANSLTGPWSFATLDLPADFAQIPSSSPASVILSSVPGTEEAKDAVLLAQIPTTMTVNPTAAANVSVDYGGDPQFAPISGTSLYYATNTQDKVIQVGDVYYLCLQGVWFLSPMPQGPWTVANSIPQVIYTIPPSSPVYNVTYVTQTVVAGNVESSYTAGYMGAFVVGAAVGAIVASGSGYYYPPYIYHPAYGYPAYYPYPATYGAYGVYGASAHYNTATGAYGVSQTVAGPYGTATRGGSYNPYTGTSTRYASASTAYGSASAARAYNPYTGTYAATKQGSSPTAQWGSSVVSNGNKSAYSQHYSTAQGTVGSVQTSAGGKAVGSSTAYGNSAVGKTANGDMYAGHDGNVYKNTGSGWQSYNNGSWNQVKPPTATPHQQSAQSFKSPSSTGQSSFNKSSAGSSSQMQGLQREAQNRQRGAQESSRFQQSGSGRFGGGRFGGGDDRFGGGGDRFGGGRR
jgi:hypothetical protein